MLYNTEKMSGNLYFIWLQKILSFVKCKCPFLKTYIASQHAQQYHNIFFVLQKIILLNNSYLFGVP